MSPTRASSAARRAYVIAAPLALVAGVGCASNRSLPAAQPPVVATPEPGPPARAPEANPFPQVTLESLGAGRPVECARDSLCRVDGFSPAGTGEPVRADGAQTVPPAVGWIHVVHPGAEVRTVRRANHDLLGVVVVGRARLALAEASGGVAVPASRGDGGAGADAAQAATSGAHGGTVAEAWTAFVLPENGASIRAEGDAPTALVLIAAAAGPSDTRQGVAADGPRARGGYVVRRYAETTDLAWGDGAFRARIYFEPPASRFASLELLVGRPDAPVAEHDHPRSWEVLAALSAAGQLRIPEQPLRGADGGAGIRAHDREVSSGSVVHVPVGVRHAWVPSGRAPLIAVQSYAPAGPEQRFRALADAGR